MGVHAVCTAAPNDVESGCPFEITFNLRTDAVVVVDDSRLIQAASEAACDLCGRERTALLAHRIDDCLEPESRARLLSSWPGRNRATRRVRDVVIVRPDGTRQKATVTAKANIVPGHHLLVFERDMDPGPTDEVLELESLFEESRDLLIVTNMAGHFVRANPACERVLGYTQSEFLAGSLLGLVHPEDLAATAAILDRLREGLSRCRVTPRLRRSDGTHRLVQWSIVRVPGHDLLTAVGRVASDADADDAPAVNSDPDVISNVPGDVAEGSGWLREESLRGLEPSFVWAIEQHLHILDTVARLSPEPRVAAVRCALALRQALAAIDTLVGDLRRPPVAADDGHGSPARTRRKRAARSALTLGFTQRQIEVMRLITHGYDNRMISSELFLAEVTVKKHVQNIMSKLGVANRTQAAIAGVRLGLDR